MSKLFNSKYHKLQLKYVYTCDGVGGFSFLSTEGAAFLGEGGSVFEEVECVSDNFLLGFKPL